MQTFNTLADGQVAASATAIYTSASDTPQRLTLTFVNTDSITQALAITFLRRGGTARQLFNLAFGAGETLQISGLPISSSDVIKAAADDADVVDYTISESNGSNLFIQVLDANGAVKTSTSGFSGPMTLTDDLTLKGSTGISHSAWDASVVSALWSNAPSRIEPDFHQRSFEIYDDFLLPASATVSDVMAWTSVDDSGTGTNAFQDAAGGVYNVVTAAADNDYHAMRSVSQPFLFAAGKKLWFESRFKLAEATTNESAWWFGLSDTVTTGGFQANAAGPLASYDGALIWKTPETAMTVNFETSNAGTQNTLTAAWTSTTDTWTRVGFYFDGVATTSTITPYVDVDGTGFVAGTPQDITLAGLEEMHLIYGVKAGPTAAAETLQVDLVRCVQLR